MLYPVEVQLLFNLFVLAFPAVVCEQPLRQKAENRLPARRGWQRSVGIPVQDAFYQGIRCKAI
eukprot:1538990-Pyramimonas_sp.AAC.2